MKVSDKIDGYWEEGYHYYIEFRGEALTVRDYSRRVMLETTVSYDADAAERGERVVIALADNTLSRNLRGKSFTRIKELTWDAGTLELVYEDYTPDTKLYRLRKVDHGPFSHIRIRDDEVLEGLQGTWKEWTASGKGPTLRIQGSRIHGFGFDKGGSEFHAVTYAYDKDRIRLVPASLTTDLFPGWTSFDVKTDAATGSAVLTATMTVMDMSMPLSVFARPDQLDKIEIPAAAKRPAVNTMMPHPQPGIGPMTGFLGMLDPGKQNFPSKTAAKSNYCAVCGEKLDGYEPASIRFCPGCRYELTPPVGKFCPECGRKLSEAASWCPFCGEKPDTTPPNFCPACGEKFGDPRPRFCPECGKKL